MIRNSREHYVFYIANVSEIFLSGCVFVNKGLPVDKTILYSMPFKYCIYTLLLMEEFEESDYEAESLSIKYLEINILLTPKSIENEP
jgi:hypothetical protein